MAKLSRRLAVAKPEQQQLLDALGKTPEEIKQEVILGLASAKEISIEDAVEAIYNYGSGSWFNSGQWQ